MQGHCIGVGWKEEQLVFELRGDGVGTDKVALAAGSEIAFETGDSRYCIGWREPSESRFHRCNNEAAQLAISSSQCAECFEVAQILPCLTCTGERCNNPVRRPNCVRPENHAVYLASFAPGLVKVGVSRWERRLERLAEQGARGAIIIARDDGQQVRRIETQVRKLGIPDRLFPGDKLQGLTQAVTHDDMMKELFEVYEGRVKIQTMGQWLPEPQVVRLPELLLLPSPPRLLRLTGGLRLRGRVKGVCGSLLIIEADTNETVALEAGSLVGYHLRELTADEQGEGQLALALA